MLSTPFLSASFSSPTLTHPPPSQIPNPPPLSMENTTSISPTPLEQIQPKIPPALSRTASEPKHAIQGSSAIIRRARRRAWKKRTHNVRKIKAESSSGSQQEEGEEAEVEEKITALQRIVPGGESLGADALFEETAEYILALQFQIKSLKFLTGFVEGPEKERRKLGG